MGKEMSITIEYAGDRVVEDAGGGSFYVRARTSWYPNLNGFGEHALYDLTFKVPRKYKVISVGKLQGELVEGDLAITHWVTPVPVAVAGFRPPTLAVHSANPPAHERMQRAIEAIARRGAV